MVPNGKSIFFLIRQGPIWISQCQEVNSAEGYLCNLDIHSWSCLEPFCRSIFACGTHYSRLRRKVLFFRSSLKGGHYWKLAFMIACGTSEDSLVHGLGSSLLTLSRTSNALEYPKLMSMRFPGYYLKDPC